MIPVNDLRAGKTFQIEGTPYIVLKYSHTKLGRGGAIIKISARNLINGAIEEKTFNSGASVEAIVTQKRRFKYLYQGRDFVVFIDPQSQEEVEINKKVLGEQISFLKKGQEADILFWEEKALGVDLPPKVTLEVVESAPGIKGNSATNMYKPATLENGLTVKVPLFIKVGDKVKVDTRTAEYVERVK